MYININKYINIQNPLPLSLFDPPLWKEHGRDKWLRYLQILFIMPLSLSCHLITTPMHLKR
uniref:Uncharacterized protein n=1 Tax=Anguilla anguilla TaxID=7936 RepID=A0A0E9RAB3_ANGAN